MNIGQKILAEIRRQGMVSVANATEPQLFIWSANAAEQLEALVQDHIAHIQSDKPSSQNRPLS